MKKNAPVFCNKHRREACDICRGMCHDLQSVETFQSTLYAAEFMLYEFHFKSCEGSNVTGQAAAHPFMMLVAEG